MTIPQFETITRRRVANVAIERIKSLILSGDLAPFDRLPAERELAERLGVSRPTIREAIRALIEMNVLESRHGDGTYVGSLEPRKLAEAVDFILRVDEQSLTALFETRRILEVGLVRLAAARATPDEVAHLRELADAYRVSIADVEACIALDMQFHERIAESAKSPITASMLESISSLGLESRKRTAHIQAVRDKTAIDHNRIVLALESADPESAGDAMLQHLEHVQHELEAPGT